MHKKRIHIIWPNTGKYVTTLLFQLSRRGRKLSYILNYLGFWVIVFSSFFWVGWGLFAKFFWYPVVIGNEYDPEGYWTNKNLITCFTSGIGFYFLIFAKFIKLPWIFSEDYFIPPTPLMYIQINKNDKIVKFDEIKDISFNKIEKYNLYPIKTSIKTFQKWGEKIDKRNLYAFSRTMQKVTIRLKDGQEYSMSLNLYEEIFPKLKEYFGDKWNDDWYTPRKEDKIYFPIKGLDRDRY